MAVTPEQAAVLLLGRAGPLLGEAEQPAHQGLWQASVLLPWGNLSVCLRGPASQEAFASWKVLVLGPLSSPPQLPLSPQPPLALSPVCPSPGPDCTAGGDGCSWS